MSFSYVIEADGGSRGNPGPAAYGVLIRDVADGAVVFADAQGLGVATNNVAEYRGLIAGLEALQRLIADKKTGEGEISVCVRMDSKLVVEQMSGRWRIKDSKLAKLAAEARSAMGELHVVYEWVPRNENFAADELLNAALDAAT